MENNKRNSKRRLNSLILLVAFTAVMLIVSTYAWFSSQKSVTVANLEGKVNVAEGLMVSLDAKTWSQQVDFEDYDQSTEGVADYDQEDALGSLSNIYSDTTNGLYIKNNVPSELIPVSTTGKGDDTTTTNGYQTHPVTGSEELNFYAGINVEGVELYDIKKSDLAETVTTETDFPGYFAIDLFLQNSSKIDTAGEYDNNGDGTVDADDKEVQGTTKETLQLNTNSLLQLVTGGSTITGLQNTVRVALAMYEPVSGANKTTATDVTSSVYVTADQSQILNAYKNATIADVAIWEPNAGNHADTIVNSNNSIRLTKDSVVDTLYISATPSTATATLNIASFTKTEKLPTFALTYTSTSANTALTDGEHTGIKDIYNWTTGADSTSAVVKTTTTTTDGLERQIALQTEKSDYDYSIIKGGVRNLISNTSSGAAIYEMGNEAGAVEFQMYKNTVVKCRLYVWLEGQDVDCINFASHGSGVHLDLGLVKSQEVGSGAAAS